MPEPHSNLDPIERLMLASREAERTGVFQPPPVAIAVRRRQGYLRVMRIGAGVLAAAACLFLAVSVAQFAHLQSTTTNGPSMNVAVATPGSVDWGVFSNCLAGPGQPIGSGCSHADLDADGDVDLADFRQFQTASARP